MISRFGFSQLLLPTALFLVLTFLKGGAVSSVYGTELAVTPMLIEMAPKPRTSNPFSFSVNADKATTVRLELYDMAQQQSGYMAFSEPLGSKKQSAAAWVHLDQETLKLSGSEPGKVTGKIKVPSSARGTRLVAVMVEESKEDSLQGIVVSIRYAVILRIAVEGKGGRNRGRFSDLTLENAADGLLLTGIFTNQSRQDFPVRSQAQIRGPDNRLLERVILKADSAWQKQEEETRIFPGATVRLHGRVQKLTQPGLYTVRTIHRLGKRGQLVWTKKLMVTPRHLKRTTGKTVQHKKGVRVLETPVPLTLRRDNSSLSTLTLLNNGKGAVHIRFLNEWASEQLVGIRFFPDSLGLASGGKSRVLLKQQFKKGLAPTGSVLLAQIIDADGSSRLLKIPTIVLAKS